LADDLVSLIDDGVLETSPGRAYSLDEIIPAVIEAESTGKQGKVVLVPGKQ
jgi:NADPH:quinone reductase-like Zn-dependent oxidoreductase